jgi:hypothetical protein
VAPLKAGGYSQYIAEDLSREKENLKNFIQQRSIPGCDGEVAQHIGQKKSQLFQFKGYLHNHLVFVDLPIGPDMSMHLQDLKP